MVDFVSPLDNSPILSVASSSASVVAAVDDDDFEDACSICLEPFNSDDPPTVTNCKHDYHLQCILEWSQRSKECPICWQLLVLKDPASQELLAAVEKERKLRIRRNAHHTNVDNELNHTRLDNSYMDDSDFNERIMQHFAAAAHRARYANRRGRQRTSGTGPSEFLLSIPGGDLPEVQHMHTSPEDHQSSRHEFLEVNSPNSSMRANIDAQRPSSMVQDDMTTELNSVDDRDGFIKTSQLPPESPQRSSSSEFRALSESIKSKFSAASVRYKESISKGTRGFKEKLLAHNISVKELGKGVQREMNAGITGVARMFERLDLTSKRTGVSVDSVPLSSSPGRTSNLSYEEKDSPERVMTQSSDVDGRETANDASSEASPCVHSGIPGRYEVPLAQGGN